MKRQWPIILTLAAAAACISLVAHAAKTTRAAQTVQFDRNTSVTGFQATPKGGWYLVKSFNNEAMGEVSNTVINPSELCAIPEDDPASESISIYNLHKPGKAAQNRALGSMAWSWKIDAESEDTGASDTTTAVIYLRQDGELQCMHMHNSDFATRKKTKLFK